MDPDSNIIILEQRTQARDHASGYTLMALALTLRNCQVMHSTSDAAPSLQKYF